MWRWKGLCRPWYCTGVSQVWGLNLTSATKLQWSQPLERSGFSHPQNCHSQYRDFSSRLNLIQRMGCQSNRYSVNIAVMPDRNTSAALGTDKNILLCFGRDKGWPSSLLLWGRSVFNSFLCAYFVLVYCIYQQWGCLGGKCHVMNFGAFSDFLWTWTFLGPALRPPPSRWPAPGPRGPAWHGRSGRLWVSLPLGPCLLHCKTREVEIFTSINRMLWQLMDE